MARYAVTIAQDESGRFLVLSDPSVPLADQRAEAARLARNGLRDGETQYTYLEVISGTNFRATATRERTDRMLAQRAATAKANAQARERETAEAPAAEVVSREDLEAQATELGIPFNARTKDETIQERINEKLNG